MDLNVYIFQKINGLSGKNRWLDALARAGGELVIFGMLGWFVVSVWMVPDFSGQFVGRAILTLLASGAVGWAMNWILAAIIREPRPFLAIPADKEMFRPLFPKLFTWKSFPSDHSMWSFTIFFTALVLHLPLAWPLALLALWVGIGRIFAGVHYPGDIVGGFAVAAFVGAAANYLINVVKF
ncbi:MAG: phosphatase PAP2 family protein [Candidatus Magasanikbacteria bacterium]|jgi:undecaprenyl-diphosphatase